MLITIKFIEAKLEDPNDPDSERVILDINGKQVDIGAGTFHDVYPDEIEAVLGRKLTSEEVSWTWREGADFPASREFPDHATMDIGGRCYCPLCIKMNCDPEYASWTQRQPHTPATKMPDELKQPVIEEAKAKFPKSLIIFSKEGGSQWATIQVDGLKGDHYRRYDGPWDQPGGKWVIASPDYAKFQGLDVLEHDKLNNPTVWKEAVSEVLAGSSYDNLRYVDELPDNLTEQQNKDIAELLTKKFRAISKMKDSTLYSTLLWITWSWSKESPWRK